MFFGGRTSDDEEGTNPFAAILMMLLAPFAALLIQMAISRTREYGADAAAARALGTPKPMIDALRQLEASNQRIPMDTTPAMQHMFIMKPFSGSAMSRLFSTHPSTEDRIRHLEQLAS
jgi:heat shock protein HtpX